MANQPSKRSKAATIAKANQFLIRSYVLIEGESPDYQLALHNAEQGLELAQMRNLWWLEAKAQRLRGHCFKYMGELRKAYDCYVRSASVFVGTENVEDLTKECLEMMDREKERCRVEPLKLRPRELGSSHYFNKELQDRGKDPTWDRMDGEEKYF